jgi:GNAT superfamily N-acetyltransferase
VRPFRPDDTEAVVSLWADAGLTKPWNDPRKDIARKAAVQPELFVVAVDENERLVGAVMAGYDGHRGWMNYLAAASDARRTGIGRALVAHVEAALLELGCPSESPGAREQPPGGRLLRASRLQDRRHHRPRQASHRGLMAHLLGAHQVSR